MADATLRTIHGIFGHEPKREGEYPFGYVLGHAVGMPGIEGKTALVTRIEYSLVPHGDYDLGWFAVYASVDNQLEQGLCSVSERAVAEIQFVPIVQPNGDSKPAPAKPLI